MATPNSRSRLSRLAKFLGGIVLLLVVLYFILLIPESKPQPPRGAGKQPFLWQQDPFWTELETQFKGAKAAGCDAAKEGIDSSLAAIRNSLDQFSGSSLAPQDSAFSALEEELFRLAPAVAACPQR